MNEKKEKEIIEEVAITTSSQDSTANNTDLEIEQVIEKIDLLSQNHPNKTLRNAGQTLTDVLVVASPLHDYGDLLLVILENGDVL